MGSVPGREEPLEEEMATHFSILAWKIPWTEESDGLQSSRGPQRVESNLMTERAHTHTHIHTHTHTQRYRSIYFLCGDQQIDIDGYRSFPDSSVGKESPCNAGNSGSISESGRSSGEGIGYPLWYSWASLVTQLVKNLPAMWKTWVQSLGWEDPLDKGKATHFSILAWRIPWTV